MALAKNITDWKKWLGVVVIGSSSALAIAGEGKLIGTAALTQVEGSGGGGIVPWATLSGYDSRDEVSVSAFSTRVGVQDYRLHVSGVGVGLYDRVELTGARQTFDLTTLGAEIKQNVLGLKVRLYGDIVYSSLPQLSLGVQHKSLLDKDIASVVGAKGSKSGTDIYLAATKLHLGAVYGYNLVWNTTARATKANQMGLLGYAGNKNDAYELMLEGSLGVFLSRHLAVGVEYRQKPDNLGLKEEDWKDFFVSYIPNKHVNATVAWADLGDIAGAKNQQGIYLSLTGYLW
jgi:Protein of unknown function (DUF3034)